MNSLPNCSPHVFVIFTILLLGFHYSRIQSENCHILRMTVEIWDIDFTVFYYFEVKTVENENKVKTRKKVNDSNRTRREEYEMGRVRLLVILVVRLIGNIGALAT